MAVELTMPRFLLVTKETERRRKREREKDKKERNFSLSWIFISRKGILHFDVSLEGQVGSLRNSSTKLCDSPEKETVFSRLCTTAKIFYREEGGNCKERNKWRDIYNIPGIDVFILIHSYISSVQLKNRSINLSSRSLDDITSQTEFKQNLNRKKN